MHFSRYVLLLGAGVGILAQSTDSAVDCCVGGPPSQPLSRCPVNEHFETDSNSCQITCENMEFENVMGACVPTSACYCDTGYVRGKNGTCIKRKDCPSADCKKGEEYSECGSSCPPSCENKGNTCLVCTEQCVPGCYCAGKTIRAQDGTCVKPENCPPRKCTGRNEIFDLCPPTCPRTEKCENLWSKIPCTPIDCCKPQCRCKPGYFRNDQNVCVTAKQCSMPACGPNEVSTDCLNDCQKTCKNRFKNQVCTQICQGSGCICKPDYFRHDNGTCVQEHECSPADCNKGEVYSSCGSACPPSCENKGNTCLGCTQQCVPGCYCAGKTIRAQDGTCVKPKNCPPRRCSGRNEIFDPCPPTCPRTDKCENLWSKKPCTPIDCCEPKCRCKPGYYRNDQNVCVTAKQCTSADCDKCSQPPSCKERDQCQTCADQCESGCNCAGKAPENCSSKNVRMPNCCVPKCRCKQCCGNPAHCRQVLVRVPVFQAAPLHRNMTGNLVYIDYGQTMQSSMPPSYQEPSYQESSYQPSSMPSSMPSSYQEPSYQESSYQPSYQPLYSTYQTPHQLPQQLPHQLPHQPPHQPSYGPPYPSSYPPSYENRGTPCVTGCCCSGSRTPGTALPERYTPPSSVRSQIFDSFPMIKNSNNSFPRPSPQVDSTPDNWPCSCTPHQ